MTSRTPKQILKVARKVLNAQKKHKRDPAVVVKQHGPEEAPDTIESLPQPESIRNPRNATIVCFICDSLKRWSRIRQLLRIFMGCCHLFLMQAKRVVY